MSGSAQSIVIAYVRCAEGRREELIEVLKASQERSRADDGCVRYGFAQAVEDPDAFMAVEEWSHREALAAHLRTENIRELMTALGPLVAAQPELTSYEVDPQPMPF